MQLDADFSNTKILIVDDSPDSRYFMSKLLMRWGITSDTAADGAQGVSMALGGDYDLILMDTQMPFLDGNEATSKLRSAGFKKPIVALTSHTGEHERSKAMNSGCDDYLEKPLDRERLLRILSNCVTRATASNH